MLKIHLSYALLLSTLAAAGWYRMGQQTLEQQAYAPESGLKAIEGEILTVMAQIEESASQYRNPHTELYAARAIQTDSLVKTSLAQIPLLSLSEYPLFADTLRTRLGRLADNDPEVLEKLNELLPSNPDLALCPLRLLCRQTGAAKTRTLQLLRTQYLMALRTVLNYQNNKTYGRSTCCWCGPIEIVLVSDRLFPTVGDTLHQTVVYTGHGDNDPRVDYVLVNGDTLPDMREGVSTYKNVYPTPGVYPLSVTMVYREKPLFKTSQKTTKDYWVRVR